MLRITVVAVGKIKSRALTELIGEYVVRLSKFCALTIIETPDEQISARDGEAEIIRRTLAEAGGILGRLRDGAYIVALDMNGDAPDSLRMAKKLADASIRYPEIIFIVGGSHGLHPVVTKRADYILSMSNLTFPHQLARLILLEQLYRSFKINNNETYHK